MLRVSIIGIGNTLMGDDGLGVRVAERLRPRLRGLDGVSVVTGHTAGMALMPHVLSADAVYFIDAVASGDEAGAIYRFDPDEAGVTKTRSQTSHGIGIPYLITGARLQGHFPSFVVYGVHVADTMCGPDTLTPPVSEALPRVADMIANEIEDLVSGSDAAGAAHS